MRLGIRIFFIIVTFSLIMIRSTTAMAREFYIGVRAGGVYTPESSLTSDVRFHMGGLLGFAEDNKYRGAFAGELDFSIPVADVDEYEYDISTIGAYMAYRTPHAIFAKAKIGYIGRFPNSGSRRYQNGVSGGFGVGFRVKRFISFEIEFTILKDTLNWLSGDIVVSF